MSGGYENTHIIGNVGRDPELRESRNGDKFCTFTVAVNTKRGDVESVNWYRVITWKGLAEVCQQYVTKDGKAVGTLDMTARDVQFLSRIERSDGYGSDMEPELYFDVVGPSDESDEDEIPF